MERKMETAIFRIWGLGFGRDIITQNGESNGT